MQATSGTGEARCMQAEPDSSRGVDTGDRVGKDFSGYEMPGEHGPEGEGPGVESGNLDPCELWRGIAACTREDEPCPGEPCMKMAGCPGAEKNCGAKSHADTAQEQRCHPDTRGERGMRMIRETSGTRRFPVFFAAIPAVVLFAAPPQASAEDMELTAFTATAGNARVTLKWTASATITIGAGIRYRFVQWNTVDGSEVFGTCRTGECDHTGLFNAEEYRFDGVACQDREWYGEDVEVCSSATTVYATPKAEQPMSPVPPRNGPTGSFTWICQT